jgi:hypothetical protein
LLAQAQGQPLEEGWETVSVTRWRRASCKLLCGCSSPQTTDWFRAQCTALPCSELAKCANLFVRVWSFYMYLLCASRKM